MRFLILVLASLSVSAAWSSTIMRGEFGSMQRCLSAIVASSGQQLQIVTDKPDRVSGKLSDGRFFMCKKIESGSKGTYFEATFDAK